MEITSPIINLLLQGRSAFVIAVATSSREDKNTQEWLDKKQIFILSASAENVRPY
jgi:hypothetical protein